MSTAGSGDFSKTLTTAGFDGSGDFSSVLRTAGFCGSGDFSTVFNTTGFGVSGDFDFSRTFLTGLSKGLPFLFGLPSLSKLTFHDGDFGDNGSFSSVFFNFHGGLFGETKASSILSVNPLASIVLLTIFFGFGTSCKTNVFSGDFSKLFSFLPTAEGDEGSLTEAVFTSALPLTTSLFSVNLFSSTLDCWPNFSSATFASHFAFTILMSSHFLLSICFSAI